MWSKVMLTANADYAMCALGLKSKPHSTTFLHLCVFAHCILNHFSNCNLDMIGAKRGLQVVLVFAHSDTLTGRRSMFLLIGCSAVVARASIFLEAS